MAHSSTLSAEEIDTQEPAGPAVTENPASALEPPLQAFVRLLHVAYHASEAVDFFDIRGIDLFDGRGIDLLSEDQFTLLCHQQDRAFHDFHQFCKDTPSLDA